MGGGVSQPSVPLSQTQLDSLKAEYNKRKLEEIPDEAVQAELEASLPAIIVYNQVID